MMDRGLFSPTFDYSSTLVNSLAAVSNPGQNDICWHAWFELAVVIVETELDLKDHIPAIVGIEDVGRAELGLGGDVEDFSFEAFVGHCDDFDRQPIVEMHAMEVLLGDVGPDLDFVCLGDVEQGCARLHDFACFQ